MKFKNKEWNKLDDCQLNWLVDDFINCLIDRLQISKADLISIIDCTDDSKLIIKKMKIRRNFLQCRKGRWSRLTSEFKLTLINADTAGRVHILLDQMLEHKISTRQISTVANYASMLYIFGIYPVSLNNQCISDWMKIIDLIKQKLTV